MAVQRSVALFSNNPRKKLQFTIIALYRLHFNSPYPIRRTLNAPLRGSNIVRRKFSSYHECKKHNYENWKMQYKYIIFHFLSRCPLSTPSTATIPMLGAYNCNSCSTLLLFVSSTNKPCEEPHRFLPQFRGRNIRCRAGLSKLQLHSSRACWTGPPAKTTRSVIVIYCQNLDSFSWFSSSCEGRRGVWGEEHCALVCFGVFCSLFRSRFHYNL